MAEDQKSDDSAAAASDGAAASLNMNQENTSESDYGHLDLSFDDLGNIGVPSDEPDLMKKTLSFDDDKMNKPTKKDLEMDYILGTLIVRVVAARDLEPVNKGGLGKMLFGGGRSVQSRRSAGSANPYASVRFGKTTQRTSEVYDTIDPIWPRGEAMYMDVTHPALPEEPVTVTTEYNEEEDSSSSFTEPLKKASNNLHSPSKATVSKAAAKAQAESPRKSRRNTTSTADGDCSTCAYDYQLEKPILTVALFHASEMGKAHNNKFPSKKGGSSTQGDSDDVFLGMTAVDVTHVLTGKRRTLDEWLPLQGASQSTRAYVRLVCEYEASDAPPRPGDAVRLTGYCHPADVYPLQVAKNRVYRVEESDGDNVLISYTSPEGWVSSFLAHRFMVVCEERHQAAMEVYQDELASIQARLSHSPLISVVSDTVTRVPDDGLVSVAEDAIKGGATLLNRWFQGGVKTAVSDLAFATNWDGRFNPDLSDENSMDDDEEDEQQESSAPDDSVEEEEAFPQATESVDPNYEPLPNMPSCPITGEPMRDPVVAADGHTYERSAIARWLKTSNKSPLSGSVLPHKNLVPNYMLLSSLQEAATAIAEPAPTPVILVEGVEEEDLLSIDTFNTEE